MVGVTKNLIIFQLVLFPPPPNSIPPLNHTAHPTENNAYLSTFISPASQCARCRLTTSFSDNFDILGATRAYFDTGAKTELVGVLHRAVIDRTTRPPVQF
jgi:hypothetical protein